MDLEAKFKEVMSLMTVKQSDWTFRGSTSATVSLGTPWVRVIGNVTAGAIWLQQGSRPKVKLTYGGAGGGVGFALVPFPVNFSFALPDMPSEGVVYKLPFAGKSLGVEELKGAAVILEFAGDVGAGCSGTIMFLGGSTLYASMVAYAGGGLMVLPTLLATSNACVKSAGLTATLLPANVSAVCYVGSIG